MKLLGITLDYKLDSDPHISNICKKAATQLNVLSLVHTRAILIIALKFLK